MKCDREMKRKEEQEQGREELAGLFGDGGVE